MRSGRSLPGWVLSVALGVSLFAGSLSANPVINEVQSTNTGLPDQYGNLMDWVEIHNPTGGTIDISGYYLSDSTSNRTKYTFPAGTTIAAGGYLLVWCGTTSEYALGTTVGGPIPSYPAGEVRTTSFAISSGGEPVVLSAPDPTPDNGIIEAGAIVDQYSALIIGTSGGVGRSLGRGTGASFETLYFYTSPTRGTVNNTSGSEAIPLDPPTFSLAGGIYSANQTLELSTAASNAVIRYTTDGSDPTESSPIYSNAISLTNPARTPNSGMSYVPSNNLGGGDEDRWITPAEAPARVNVVRAKVFKTGNSPSRTATRSYVIDALGTNRHKFPIVSLATTPGNITNSSNGIYVYGTNTYPTNWSPGATNGAVPSEFWANYFQSGSGWERPGNVEIFERNGSQLLSGEIGLRINGQTTRVRPRKALRVYNRNSAGSTVWNAQMFPDKNVTNHERFILRASGNDWARALFRDAYMSDLATGLSLDRQHTRPVVLFLSGEYWGIHNLRDRLDEPWVFHHYGLSEADYAFLEVTYGGPNFLNDISDNSGPIYDHGNPDLLDDYKDILTRAGNNEFATAAGYTNLNARVDVENYIDYMAVTIFGGNTDWPGNNIQMWRSATNLNDSARPKIDGRWRYVIKDNDFALGVDLPYVPGYATDAAEMAQFDVLAHASSSVSNSFANNEIATRLFRKVLENPIFRTNFINRYADLLNSTLSTNNTLGLLQRYADTYGPGVEEHFKRWPVDGQNPTNYWTNVALARVRTYLTARTEAVRSHVQNRFGLGTAALTVNVNNTNAGTVTVNRLNINPATPGLPNSNAPYPWTGTYFQDVAIPITAVPKPGYRFTSWTLAGSTNGASTVIASDSTANYSTWTNGANGGTGFGAWTLSDTESGSDGFFMGSSGRRIHNAAPDQRSFGIFAHSGGSASATRLFGSALGTNQTFSVKISPGGFTPASHKGVRFGTAATNWFEFFASDFGSAPAYYFRNGTNTARIDSGSFWANTDYTFDLSVTRTASNSYTVTIARGSQSFTTNLTSATTVDRAYFYSFGNSDGDDTNNLYFNMPRISQVAAADDSSSTSTNSTVSVTLAASRALTANFESVAASGLALQLPASGAAGMSLSGLQVIATNALGEADGTFTNSVVLTVAGDNDVTLYYTNNAVAGVATFSNVIVPSGAAYAMSASSGALSSGAATNLVISDGALYLPTNNNAWSAATNWNVNTVPNSTTARTLFSGVNTNRDINLSNATTVATIIATNGSARDRIRNGTTNGIILRLESASGPSTIKIAQGTGTGFLGFDFTGNTALQFVSDVVLDVQNTNSANAEYGGLRFQSVVSGAGNITKRGPGHAGFTGAGKTFSGNILIEQGVLGFSATGASNASTNITVQAGGQLRLSAAQSGAQVTNGTPILHPFAATINLAGSGRTGVPDSENLGVLGALRYEPNAAEIPSGGTTASLTNSIILTNTADIHVSGTTNGLVLSGPLTATASTNRLTKSGGGALTLATNSSSFTGGITVNRGTLNFSNAAMSANTNSLVLATNASLAGTGHWGGALQGSNSAISLRLGASPAASAPLRVASAALTGSNNVALTVATNTVAGTYPLLQVDGSFVGTNTFYFATMPSNFSASTLSVSNGVLYATLSAPPLEAWNALYSLTGSNALDTADADGDGISNIVERAMGLNPTVADPSLPIVKGSVVDGVLTFTARVAKNQSDLTVTVLRHRSSDGWTTLTPTSSDASHPDYTVRTYTLDTNPEIGVIRVQVAR